MRLDLVNHRQSGYSSLGQWSNDTVITYGLEASGNFPSINILFREKNVAKLGGTCSCGWGDYK